MSSLFVATLLGSDSHGDGEVATDAGAASEAVPRVVDATLPGVELGCRACGLTFSTSAEQRAHYRSDEHLAHVAATLALIDSSSSDEDDGADGGEEAASGGTPFVLLRFADGLRRVWKALLPPDLQADLRLQRDGCECSDSRVQRALAAAVAAPPAPTWVLVLFRAGRFAAGVFVGGSLVAHKTIAKYTTRRKQGGSQAAKDSHAGSRTRSAGSWLRRRNEAMMQEEMRELLHETWAEHLHAARLLLVGTSKRTLPIFVGSSGMLGRDERVRRVPVQFARPTLEELRRVFLELCDAPHVAAGAARAALPPATGPRARHSLTPDGARGGAQAAAIEPEPTAMPPSNVPAATATELHDAGPALSTTAAPQGASSQRNKKRRNRRKDKTARQLAAAGASLSTAGPAAAVAGEAPTDGSESDAESEREAQAVGDRRSGSAGRPRALATQAGAARLLSELADRLGMSEASVVQLVTAAGGELQHALDAMEAALDAGMTPSEVLGLFE